MDLGRARIAATPEEGRELLASLLQADDRATPLDGDLLTWRQAEELAARWMRDNGYPDAQVTASGPDGGVDVRGRGVVAQVKHHAKPVGLAEVQRLSGIARAEGSLGLFFSRTGFTASALEWASRYGVVCYHYPPVTSAH